MFKYLMLSVSLMLALPSYAVENIFNGGTSTVNCVTKTRAQIPLTTPLNGSKVETGEMNLGITGIQFSAGADAPGLTGLTSEGPAFDCPRIAGFKMGLLDTERLAPNLLQVGTLEITPPRIWYGGDYFDIGNGLAMKVLVGDNNGVQRSPTETSPIVITYDETNQRGTKQIGLKVQATLKVIDKNIALGARTVKIGTFSYTLTDLQGRIQVATVPVSFNINVTQANLRSCELTTKDREFNLTAVKREDIFVRGTEVPGGDIQIGPVKCQEGVDVKVNFFDHHNTERLTDHLRTVYSDTLEPSQYALKIYPTTGGGQPLQFLPLSAFAEGRNAVVNETTVDFATNTMAGSSIQKNYRVNYVRLGTVGDDRPGKIKGIMTVEFLYY